LQKARQAGYNISCKNNLKQIGLGGLMMYANDYDSWSLGGTYRKFGGATSITYFNRLCSSSGPYPGLGYLGWKYGTKPYPKYIICPVAENIVGTGMAATRYLLPSTLSGSAMPWRTDSVQGLFKADSPKKPTALMWLADASQYDGAMYPWHNVGINMFFVDGHISQSDMRAIRSLAADYRYFPFSGNFEP